MKRFCFLLLGVALLLCVGCSRQLNDEGGYIYRNDIELGDFAFLFNEWEHEPGKTDKEIGLEIYNAFRRDAIKPEDIFDALGLPGSTTEDYGVISYTYLAGDGHSVITIKYIPEEDMADIDLSIDTMESEEDEENLLMIWSSGGRKIDPGKYKMQKIFDISIDKLEFIGETTTSEEVQQLIGAPHYYIKHGETSIESAPGNAFVYELIDGNIFKIIYFRQGYILRAWVEDKGGKEIKLIIDRGISSFYEEGQ